MVSDNRLCPMIAYDYRLPMIAHNHRFPMIAHDGLLAMVSDHGTATAVIAVTSRCPFVCGNKG
jgi:hypothetical protein